MDSTKLPNNGEITSLILQELVHKLVERNMLSEDDVRDLLFGAAERIDIVGDTLTPQAARDIVREELLPAFLRRRR